MSVKGRHNYRHNRALEAGLQQGEMINGQGLGAVSRMKYGLCRMSFNGCECIAVYNALVYLGLKPSLSEVALRLERYKMLFGLFGCDPHRLGRVLMQYGADFRKTEAPGTAEAFIISYWTGRRFFSSIHTVFCTRCGDTIKIYNRYNNLAEVYCCRSAAELTGGQKPVSAYIFPAVGEQTHPNKT